jgi:hypothetical protein
MNSFPGFIEATALVLVLDFLSVFEGREEDDDEEILETENAQDGSAVAGSSALARTA